MFKGGTETVGLREMICAIELSEDSFLEWDDSEGCERDLGMVVPCTLPFPCCC